MLLKNYLLNVKLLLLLANLSNCEEKQHYEYEQRELYRLGEFNDRCQSKKDCRQFGYVCRENHTCQCDYMYIPDVKKHSCVGGVNQRCIYDEHCIEGAYCMNQAVCKCKNSSPIELEDGLVCAGGNWWKFTKIFLLSTLLTIYLIFI